MKNNIIVTLGPKPPAPGPGGSFPGGGHGVVVINN